MADAISLTRHILEGQRKYPPIILIFYFFASVFSSPAAIVLPRRSAFDNHRGEDLPKPAVQLPFGERA